MNRPSCSSNVSNHVIFSTILAGMCLSLDAAHSLAQQQGHAIVPAYERFQTNAAEGWSATDAGKLLISELNCQSCHGALLQESLPQRQAPVLTATARRIHPEHLIEFINNPQATKHGTAMPQMFSGAEAHDAATALAHFLSSDGAVVPMGVSADAVNRGEKLFSSIGCVACHGDLNKPLAERAKFAMPLGNLEKKYTVGSLSAFLKDPHAVRPSGRMPSLNLNDKEAGDVANYLLKGIEVEPNLTFELFDGNYDKLPDFDSLSAKASGSAAGFSIAVAGRKERFALRFRGFLHLKEDGKYKIWLGSDDGSRMLIDNKEVLNSDGVHPHSNESGEFEFAAGPHRVVVEYFEKGGFESLSVEIEGPGVKRQPMANLVSTTEEPPETRRSFQTDPQLVAKGRQLFVTAGCASCHKHDAVKDLTASKPAYPNFEALDLSAGCLSTTPVAGVPQFALTQRQRSDIASAVKSLLEETSDQEIDTESKINSTLATLNCYACHQRNKIGGVPRVHDSFFTGTIPEMGDEGRLPPHLDGIGDKLQPSWLKKVMNEGTKDRPYVTTRMPKFGEQNVGTLIKLFEEADQKTEVPEVKFSDPDHRVIAEARLMVGDQALSCIKCHYFDKHKATGIQSLDMTTMTQRLRRDWFHRYLINPQAYRPGTRMPSAWPNNRTVVPHILHGDPAQQIQAIWRYLSDGKKAKIPSGLIAKVIELKPTDKPMIYRNFIEGLSSRGIAVGYPEKAHVAWDAEQMNLRLIWHGAFIDASMHWTGRGQGRQSPLGDHALLLTDGQPLAILDSANTEWPKESARENGFDFLGYRLDDAGRPTFRYQWNGITATDLLIPVAGEKEASLQRELTFTAAKPAEGLHLRLAAAKTIEPKDGGWLIDNALQMRVTSGDAVLRTVNGMQELLVPINFAGTSAKKVVVEMTW